MENEKECRPSGKIKSFFKGIFAKLDKKIEEKSKSQKCCCKSDSKSDSCCK